MCCAGGDIWLANGKVTNLNHFPNMFYHICFSQELSLCRLYRYPQCCSCLWQRISKAAVFSFQCYKLLYCWTWETQDSATYRYPTHLYLLLSALLLQVSIFWIFCMCLSYLLDSTAQFVMSHLSPWSVWASKTSQHTSPLRPASLICRPTSCLISMTLVKAAAADLLLSHFWFINISITWKKKNPNKF